MIKSFKVIGLWGRQDYVFEALHEDLNIFTGSNGAGKTTLLKLMWYMISGHIQQALAEVEFREAEIVTNSAILNLQKRPAKPAGRYEDKHPRDGSPIAPDTPVAEIHMKRLDMSNIFSLFPIPLTELKFMVNSEGPAVREPSLFFPTFRRVEGGFSLEEGEERSKINEGFKDYSKRMTHNNHLFLAFADSDDIHGLLNEISSDIRVKLQPYEDSFTSFLATGINGSANTDFTMRLRNQLSEIEAKRTEFRRPLEMLNQYIDSYFLEKSVRVSELVLGTNSNRVPIDRLSAGEKNFLSFLVYALSNPEAAIFIDEPELTLHIDWQRQLLGIIRHIAPNVQIFVATHSPAIRAAYPDKKFWLNEQFEEEAEFA